MTAETATAPNGPLDFQLVSIDDKPYPLSALKGKVVMLVMSRRSAG
jgi:hypothetical protein